MTGAVAPSVHLDDAAIDDPAVAADQVDSGVREPLDLSGVVVVGHHVVTPRERCSAVGIAVDGLRGARGGERGVERLAGTQQRLRRNARVVGALPRDEFALDDRNGETPGGERPSAVLARRTGAEHDHVVIGIHVSLLRGGLG